MAATCEDSCYQSDHLQSDISDPKTRNEKAVQELRCLVTCVSLQRPGFNPRSFHVGFVVDKVALEQVFLQVF